MTAPKTRDEVLEMLRSQRTAMVTTLDGDQLVSRPMAPMHVDDDGTLWFFTEADSDKADQVESIPHMNVSFSHGDYLSVSGTGQVVRDVEQQKALWNKAVESWLQCEPDDPKVRLLEVQPSTIAYWSTPNTVATLLGMAKAVVTEEQPDLGDSGVVNV